MRELIIGLVLLLSQWSIASTSYEHLTVDNFLEELETLKIKEPHFYKVEKEGRVAYVLGTVHLAMQMKHLPEYVLEKFEKASVLMPERNMIDDLTEANLIINDFQTYILNQFKQSRKDGAQSYSSNELKKFYVYSSKERQFLKSWGISEALIDLLPRTTTFSYWYNWPELSFTRPALDYELMARAMLSGKTVISLEDAVARGNARSYAKPVETGESVENSRKKDIQTVVTQILQSGDASLIIRKSKNYVLNVIKQKYLISPPHIQDDEFRGFDHYLVYRNFHWLPRIESALEAEIPFVAVGVSHLYGELGILHELEHRGYKVTLVTGPEGVK